ncbi:MAG: RNB domain-containing ribonuclease [Dermatophilaceae bacterium]
MARYSDEGIAEVLGDAALRARFAAIRGQFGVPETFPPDVLAEAEAVAGAPLEWPDRDETDLPFFTIDPPGSLDLDQAMHLAREGEGYRVRYAIVCLPAFVAPGGAIDTEARRRGQTIYCPDTRVPLHPPILSEGAASLLPGAVRAAYVWDLRLGSDGEVTSADVHRALVRSVERLDYAHVQGQIEAGTDDERFLLLREIGEARIACERRRGGASLPMPEQVVTENPDGSYALSFRPPLAAEEWNAQISLMTGMAAAGLMLGAGIGILRTLPAPDPQAVERFRRQATALGVPWLAGEAYGDFLRRLDRTEPKHLALIYEATSLFRGSAYAAFDGAPPAHPEHGALAADYAHVTAPLRRLVDRFGLAVCEAISGGGPVPAWAREALPALPELMATSGRTASGVERTSTDTVEAAVLATHLGEEFRAVIVDHGTRGSWVVQLLDPAVVTQAGTQVRVDLGDVVTARLVEADIDTGVVRLQVAEVVGAAPAPTAVDR